MIPEETSPLNLKENQETDLLNQRHEKALINLVQQVLPHSDNIHRSHQVFLPVN